MYLPLYRSSHQFRRGYGLKLLVDVVGLVHIDCISKMRLMSLVDLGLNESSQIPYSVIKQALQVHFSSLFCLLMFLLCM